MGGWGDGGGLSGPFSTGRWRLKQRAGVCQRGCALLRRRKDGEDSAPRSSSEDCTSSSAASEPRCSFLLLFSPLLSISCCFLGQNCRIVGKNVFPPHTCAITGLRLLSSNGNKLLNIYVYFKEGDVSGCTHTQFYTCTCLPCITLTVIAHVMKVYILCSQFNIFTAVMVS